MPPETYATLQHRLDLPRELPHDPRWSAAPDFLGILADHCLGQRPQTIVECGSGTSTLVLARCCQLAGRGRVYSLEHEAGHAAQTRSLLEGFGLAGFARVIEAPLRRIPVGEARCDWYGIDGLSVPPIDLLVIDGPPGLLTKNARYPALPVLRERFAGECTVFLDDAARPDEREIVALWQAGLDPDACEYLDTERGCVRLRFGPAGR